MRSASTNVATSAELPLDAVEAAEAAGARPASLLRQAIRLRRSQIGMAIMTALMLVAVFGRYVAPFNETEIVGDGLPNARHVKDALFGSGGEKASQSKVVIAIKVNATGKIDREGMMIESNAKKGILLGLSTIGAKDEKENFQGTSY